MVTEEKIGEMLENVVFTDSRHREALKNRLSSMPGELSMDELEKVAGGQTLTGFELLDVMPGSFGQRPGK